MLKIKSYFKLLRAFSFLVSIFPIIAIAIFMLSRDYDIGYLFLILEVLFVLFLHIAVNVRNDQVDYVRNIDTLKSFGSSGVLTNKLLKLKEVKIIADVCFISAIILGLLILYYSGSVLILLLLLFSFLGAYFYTHNSFGYKYFVLGEVFVFTLLGPILAVATGLLLTEIFEIGTVYLGVLFGLPTAAILLGNNLRDINTDRESKIITLPILIGANYAKRLYVFLLFTPYLILLISIYLNIFSWVSSLAFLSIPFAVYLLRFIYNHKDLKCIDIQTAKFHFIFLLLLVISFLLS
ncbi:MAG: prenyltransferase [bacterium]|nr:prenyltransferase [bacterium]